TSGGDVMLARAVLRAGHADLEGTDPEEHALAFAPEYVRCCSHNAEVPKIYSRWAWHKGDPTARYRLPYTCNSWRCPHCERHAAAVVFARVKEAFAPYNPSECVFVVLTLDP